MVDGEPDLTQLDLLEPIAATPMPASRGLELLDELGRLDANRAVLGRRTWAPCRSARLALAQTSGLQGPHRFFTR